MSGIAAVAVRGDGTPDAAHFGRWSQCLARDGDRGALAWCGNRTALAAFGFDDAGRDVSHSDDSGQGVRVVADARLDGRAELRSALTASGCRPPREASDAALISLSYGVWGERCVDHLLGDFAFVLWDEREKILFAARDHFGARQLSYALTTRGLVAASHATVVFRHPWVDRRLDDQAVVDWLVHDQVAHEATLFADIRRLPAGHCLRWNGESLSVRRYWSLPLEDELYCRDPRDYPRRLLALLRVAIKERTRGLPIGVLMSGGIDSTAVAAVACDVVESPGTVRAYTAVSGSRMVEHEKSFAMMARSHLGIGGELHDTDDFLPLLCARDSQLALPIPDGSTIGATTVALMARIPGHGRMALTGLGPDATLLSEPLLDSFRGLRPRRWIEIAHEGLRHAALYGRRPPVLLRRRREPRDAEAPAWLEAEMRRKHYRRESPWGAAPAAASGHRPRAYSAMLAGWSYLLETWGGAGSLAGVNVTHPFLDLRVVAFCLRLPPVPWCWDKRVLRDAMAELLPRPVTHRRKAPLRESWLHMAVHASGTAALAEQQPFEPVREYFALPDFTQLAPSIMVDPYTHLRPVALDLFLRAWSEQAVVA